VNFIETPSGDNKAQGAGFQQHKGKAGQTSSRHDGGGTRVKVDIKTGLSPYKLRTNHYILNSL